MAGARGRRSGPVRGGHREWQASEEAVLAFIGDPATWHEWEPFELTDPHVRAWALELRAGVTFLSVREVARRFGVHPGTVTDWCQQGLLPAQGGGSSRGWAIRSDALAGFVPPIDRPRRNSTKLERLERRARAAGIDWEELRPGVRILRLSRLREREAA